MTVRAGLACCAATALLTGCTQWVAGAPLRAAGEPAYHPPGIVDVDEVLLSQDQMRAITGAGQDLTIIPGMDGKSPVDIEDLAESVPADCRFVFAETATFGSAIEDFHKTSFQSPSRAALISEGAASYRDAATARRAFDALSATVTRCADSSYGALLVGDVDAGAETVQTRPGACGRDYGLKGPVLVEVTFCGFPESVPEIVMTNIVDRIPGG
ncbi:MAG TPA: sensor domain-containing protein [Mycobacterium sp.]|nr:sensor domain-containing protein [Mycobacterium sp.]